MRWQHGSNGKTLLKVQDWESDLYLFDTFEGTSEPMTHGVDHLGKFEVLLENRSNACANAPLECGKNVP
jgi:hypothetical protein